MLNLRPEIGHSRALFAEIGDKGMELLVEDIARLSSLRTGDSTEALVYPIPILPTCHSLSGICVICAI